MFNADAYLFFSALFVFIYSSGDEEKALLWIVCGAELNYKLYSELKMDPLGVLQHDPQALRDAEKLKEARTDNALLRRR